MRRNISMLFPLVAMVALMAATLSGCTTSSSDGKAPTTTASTSGGKLPVTTASEDAKKSFCKGVISPKDYSYRTPYSILIKPSRSTRLSPPLNWPVPLLLRPRRSSSST